MTNKWWEIPGISILMLILAVASTYPLIQYFDVGIPYGAFRDRVIWNRSGDQMQLLYWFWLVKENLLGHVPFDTNPFEFNMGIPQETTGFHTFPLALLYVLFSPLGDVAAYNATIMSSYILAGTFMYLLVRLYSGSRAGALLGAVIFTFAPSRINGLAGGNAYGMLFFLYPWIVYFLEKGIRSKKIIHGILAGLGLVCLSMLESHLLYYMCLFLAGYIPFRLIVLIPPCDEPSFGLWSYAKGLFSWSIPRSLLTLWGSGVAVVFYSQVLFAYRDQDSFFSPFFLWLMGLYPLLAVLVGICFALIYGRLSVLDFRRSLALETGALLPLYLFVPFAILPYTNNSVNTTTVVVSVGLLIFAVKLFLLRSYLLSMLQTLAHGIAHCRRHIWPIIPVICAMAYIVFWVPSTKVETLSSTIAASGRTLHDVRLYSAHLSDAFVSTSNVYIGIVAAGFLVFFFLALLWSFLINKKTPSYGKDSDLMILFFGFIAFCSYLLSMGLAFGKSSLYLLLYYYLPFFNYPRVSDRLIVMALFAVAILVGFLVQRLQQRSSRPGFAVVCLLVLVLIVIQLKDFNVFRPMGVTVLDKGQDIYSHVKNNRDDGLLLEIPLWPGDSHQSSLYQHYAMLDRIPRVNGYSPLVRTAYIEKIFKQLGTLNQGELDRRQYELLQQLDVEFITVHNNRDIFLSKVSPFGPLTTIRRLHNSPYLEYVDVENHMHFKEFDKRNDNLILFRVKETDPDYLDNDDPGWYEVPVFYGARSRLFLGVGEIVKDDDIDQKVFMASEKRHGPGFLVYGPYTHRAAGEYRCYFNISTKALKETEVGKKIARIEVSKFKENGEQRVLDQKELVADPAISSYRREYLNFSLAENSVLEFRVFYYGKGETRVEQVAVYKRNHEIPLDVMEAEKMAGRTGKPVFETKAHGGKAVEAIAGKSRKGDLVYGPNRVYPDGHYQVKYYLRSKERGEAKDSQTAAVLSVSDEHNKRVYCKRKVRVGELDDTNYQAIKVDFEISRSQELSFKVRFTGKASLLLDKIEIERN